LVPDARDWHFLSALGFEGDDPPHRRSAHRALWRGRRLSEHRRYPPGVDLRQHLDETLRATTALFAVVGPGWESKGRESIGDKFDPVRIVLEGALRRRIPIIPVLIGPWIARYE
jgi:hypothetical protein